MIELMTLLRWLLRTKLQRRCPHEYTEVFRWSPSNPLRDYKRIDLYCPACDFSYIGLLSNTAFRMLEEQRLRNSYYEQNAYRNEDHHVKH